MKFRREGFEIVLRKRYFQPQELTEILNKDAEEIKRIACVAEALYRVENLYLVDYQKIYTFICNNLMFYENQDGRYVTAAEAARNIGIPEHAVLQVFARSSAVYKLGKYTLINLEEADAYIRQYRVDIEPISIKEPKREYPKGSAFIREMARTNGI